MPKYISCLIVMLHSVAAFAEIETNGLDCIIEPHMTAELSSPVSGILQEVLVERGDRIKKGQVLARLNSGVEQAQVNLARARAEMVSEIKAAEARHDLKLRAAHRFGELSKKKLVADSEHDEAQTEEVITNFQSLSAKEEKHIAELEFQRAEQMLKQRSIMSPLTGIVVKRMKSPGEYVEETPLLKIAQIDPLNVEIIAPASMYGKISKGMEALILPEAPQGGKYPAKVVIVDSVIDAASGTFGIRLELPNPDYKILSGLRCSLEFPAADDLKIDVLTAP
jgi:RND family efflux transporter MFP subunit